MAKEIIVLTVNNGPHGDLNLNYAFWFPVTPGQQIPNPSFQSAYRGATAAEITALQSGSVVEQTGSKQYPAGTAGATIQTDLQATYSAALSAFQALPNPNQYYGYSFDGTTWTAGAVLPAKTSSYQSGAVQIAASGDTTLIAGSAGAVVSIYRLIVMAGANVSVTIKDGAAAAMLGPFPMTAGVPFVLDLSAGGGQSEPWFRTSSGNGFVINLSAAVAVSVRGWFTQA